MVRASHQSSEGCGLDPCLGFRNRFSEDRALRPFIYHLKVVILFNKYFEDLPYSVNALEKFLHGFKKLFFNVYFTSLFRRLIVYSILDCE